jgi:hypothetical protein
MKVRINQDLASVKNGIDFAIFSIYTNNLNLLNLDEKIKTNYQTRIYFTKDDTLGFVNELAKDFNLSKTEVVRRALKWLKKQKNYPVDF